MQFAQKIKIAGFKCMTSFGIHSVANGLILSRNNLFVNLIVNGFGNKNNCVKTVWIVAGNADKK